MNKLRLAALQLELKKTDNISYLLSELNNLCSKSDELDLIVLSELAVGGAGAKNCAHSFNKYENIFSDLAKKYSVYLIPGTFYEETTSGSFNIAPVFDRNGKLITKAKKILMRYAYLILRIKVI